MPWRATIRVPAERMTLEAQLEKLSALSQRATPDGTGLVNIQAEVITKLETANFAFDKVLEELAALHLTMPSLAAYICPIAPSLFVSAAVAAPPATVDADRIKRAA